MSEDTTIDDGTQATTDAPRWHYAGADRQQNGPVPAQALREAHAAGLLDRHGLVWRRGLPGWEPLELHAAELGIDLPALASVPPQVPAAPIDSTDVVYAGLWRRVAASVIDSFATSMLSYVLLIPMFLAFGVSMAAMAGTGHDDEAAQGGISLLFLAGVYAVSIGLPAVYFGWMQATRHQASLGKLAVGIKVVRGNGAAIGFWRGFLRYVAYVLVTVLTCGLGAIATAFMAGLTARKQAPHDFFCDTLVVDRWAFTDQPQRQTRGLDVVTWVVLIAYAVLLVVVAAVAIAIAMLVPATSH